MASARHDRSPSDRPARLRAAPELCGLSGMDRGEYRPFDRQTVEAGQNAGERMAVPDESGADLGQVDGRHAGLLKAPFDVLPPRLVEQQAQQRRCIENDRCRQNLFAFLARELPPPFGNQLIDDVLRLVAAIQLVDGVLQLFDPCRGCLRPREPRSGWRASASMLRPCSAARAQPPVHLVGEIADVQGRHAGNVGGIDVKHRRARSAAESAGLARPR
jgi:hypothetical protein